MSEGFTVYPRRVRHPLLLTFTQPVSHHDPAGNDGSNQSLFNRQGQIVYMPTGERFASADQMAAIVETNKVPVDLAAIFEGMPFSEFLAVALTRLFIEMYGAGNGEGLFAGMERYGYLETRMRASATSALTLRGFWGRLCRMLNVGMHAGKHDLCLLDLLSVPLGTQAATLRVIVDEAHSVIPIARRWNEIEKLSSEEYAEAVGKMAMVTPRTTVAFEDEPEGGSLARVCEVPSISTNSIRHSLVREPGFMHMMAQLGIEAGKPGEGPLPAAVESMFVNGGSLSGEQPSNAFALAHDIRARYPLLDLVSGCASCLWLLQGQLQLGAWLVCKENAKAIPASVESPLRDVSAYDMLDDVTLTRHGMEPMIAGFEALKQGAQVYVELDLLPQTMPLTHGALLASAWYGIQHMPVIGGQGARGYGRYTATWLDDEHDGELIEAYQGYLKANRDELVGGLIDGTLGTGKVLFS